LHVFKAGEGVKAVGDGGEVFPGPGVPGWAELLSRPEVEHAEVVGDVVRVRLKSGVELEWPLDDVG
jgi:hypothetical protein